MKPAHELYNLPVAKLTGVSFRAYARERLGGRTKSPQVRGITVKDRLAVLFSKEDLSTGLVGQAVDGIVGYEPQTATRIVANVILYATGEGKPPATQPSTQPATQPADTQPAAPAPARPRSRPAPRPRPGGSGTGAGWRRRAAGGLPRRLRRLRHPRRLSPLLRSPEAIVPPKAAVQRGVRGENSATGTQDG